VYYNYDNDSNVDDKPKYNDNNNINNDPKSDNNILFDFKDKGSNDSAVNENIDKYNCLNSSYNNNGTNIIIIKNTNKYYTTKLNKYKQLLCQNLNNT
jgi:hypothetical protein